MSFYQQKKDDDKTLSNQADQNQLSNSNNSERSPEFDVNGTALNDLHSLFEN